MKVGDVVGGEYRLVRPIGDGAMGAVWETQHVPTGRRVALKLIKNPDENLRKRLVREARLCGCLRHENIVELYDAGETEKGDPFLAMELLTGETVAALLQRRHALSSSITARIGRDVAYALSAAHEALIVHRDLKPTNIFLHRARAASDYVVKVLDFGVAKQIDAQDSCLTKTGAVVGSLAYMSPEQLCVAKNLDHRTDIWSVGVVMFEMVVGVRPFGGSTEDLIHAILTEDAPLVSRRVRHVDPGLAEIIARCLTRDRQKRIGSALELASMLEACTRGSSIADDLAATPLDAPRQGSHPGRVENTKPPAPNGVELGAVDSGELVTRYLPSQGGPPHDGQRKVTANGTVVIGPAELAANMRELRGPSQPEPTAILAAAPTPIAALPEPPPRSSRLGSADGPEEAPVGTSSTDGVVRWVAPPRPGSIPDSAPASMLAPTPATAPQGRRPFVDVRVAAGILVGALGLLAFAVARDKASKATPPEATPMAAAAAPVDVVPPNEAPTNAGAPPPMAMPPSNVVAPPATADARPPETPKPDATTSAKPLPKQSIDKPKASKVTDGTPTTRPPLPRGNSTKRIPRPF